MKISVRVKANAKENILKKIGSSQFSASVKAKPQKGQANRAVIDLLAEYFGVTRAAISVSTGKTSRQKTFIIKGQFLR